MKTFKSIAKTAISGIVLTGVLMITACGGGNDHPTPAPSSTPDVTASASATASETPTPTMPPSADTSLTQAQKDAIVKSATDKPLGIDPASIVVPDDIKASFGEKAAANLVHDGLAFQQMTDGFHQLQTLPRTVDMKFMEATISAKLSPLTTTETLADIIKEFNSPQGTSVVAMLSDSDAKGITVDGTIYHPRGDGFFISYGQPEVEISTQTMPVTQNGNTIQIHPVIFKQAADINIPAKEGVVKVSEKRYYNLVPTPDGHWLVAGWRIDTPVTASPNGTVGK